MKQKTVEGNKEGRELNHKYIRFDRSKVKRQCRRRERMALKAQLRRELEGEG